ncbi:MAG: helix-turn-helix transcriptional regulator [Thermoplasmatota archaeon]
MEVVTNLYYGPKRSSRIVSLVMERLRVSEPTVYATLQELVTRKILEKQERSRRRVIYRLTDEGRKLMDKEHFEIINNLLSNIKDPSRRRELLIELLLQDLIDELPEDKRASVRRDALRSTTAIEVEDMRKRLVRIASALFI